MNIRDALSFTLYKIGNKIRPSNVKQDRLQQLSSYQANRPIFSDWSTEKAIRGGYKASVWVFACVRKIATVSSSVPWYVERRTGEDEWEVEKGHPVETLLNDPNPVPMMTGRALMRYMAQHLHLSGNAIWYTPLVQGSPVEIWPLMPDKVKPIVGSDGIIKRYDYTISSGKKPIPLQSEEIVHFQFEDPSNFYWGISPLMAAAKIVDMDLEAIKWNKHSLQNRAIKDAAFFPDRLLDKIQWEALRDAFREKEAGAENARGWWIANTPGELKELSMSPAEMEFLESRKLNMLEIHAAFDIDPLLTGFPDRSGRGNKHEAQREFYQNNVIPYLNGVKDSLENSLLLPFDAGRREREEPELRLVYDISNVPALQEDFGEKVRNAERFWRMGVPLNMINQRLELGFTDVPGGDQPFGVSRLSEGTASAAAQSITGKKQKVNKRTETEKARHWKTVEEDRLSWEQRVVGRVERRFAEEMDAVVSAFEDGGLAAALREIDDQLSEWQGTYTGIYVPVIEYFGQEAYTAIEEQQGKSITPKETKAFDAERERVVMWVRRNAASRIVLVSDHTKDVVRRIVADGLRDNLTTPQIGRSIRDTYQRWQTPDPPVLDFHRSMRIARTEVQAGYGYGHHEGLLQVKEDLDLVIESEWITSIDGRQRDSHEEIDGATVEVGTSPEEVFPNGLRFPGDVSNDPTGAETIHCRCVTGESATPRR